jgi:hypothetical protein
MDMHTEHCAPKLSLCTAGETLQRDRERGREGESWGERDHSSKREREVLERMNLGTAGFSNLPIPAKLKMEGG